MRSALRRSLLAVSMVATWIGAAPVVAAAVSHAAPGALSQTVRQAAAPAPVIGTLAGSPGQGQASGLGQGMSGIAVSGSDVFLTDYLYRVIRKWDRSTGLETIFAGPGDDPGSSPVVDPGALAVDPAGNLYVSDTGRIWRLSPDGHATAVAGNGVAADDPQGDGQPALSQPLNAPGSIAIDPAGNLWFADWLGSPLDTTALIEVTTDGILHRVWYGPIGSLVPAPGGVYFTVAGPNGGTVDQADDQRQIKQVSCIESHYGDGTFAGLCLGGDINMSANGIGRLLLASDGAIYRATVGGGYQQIAGTRGQHGNSGDGGPATQATFPIGASVEGTETDAYYVEANNQLRFVDEQGTITTVLNSPNTGHGGDGGPAKQAQLYAGRGIAAMGNGDAYVADRTGQDVRVVHENGTIDTVIPPGGVYPLGHPQDVTGDGSGGLWVTTAGVDFSHTAGLLHYNSNHELIWHLGDMQAGPRAVTGPGGALAPDGHGGVFVGDDTAEVLHVSASGQITPYAGYGTPGPNGDGGQATQAQLDKPRGMALDGAGNLYIADSGNSRIRKVTPAGIISTVAGSTAGFSGDGGPAIQAHLDQPWDVKTDSAGGLLIADWGNHRVRRVNPDSTIQTIAGDGADGGPIDDGAGPTDVGLSGPIGINLVDGQLLISDDEGDNGYGNEDASSLMGHHRIRSMPYTPAPPPPPTPRHFFPLSPSRIFDPVKLVAGHDQELVVTGPGRVPVGADAAELNIEIAAPSQGGYLRVSPGGTNSSTATQEFKAGQTISNLTISKLSTNGTLRLHLSAGQATLYLDLLGYDAPSHSGDTYQPMPPNRIAGPLTLVAGRDQDLVIAGRDGIPSNADAVALNVEIASPTQAGYLRVTPGGTNTATATQEFTAGQTISNLTIAKLSITGTLRLHLSAGQANVFLDLTGYDFGTPSGDTYQPMSPSRIAGPLTLVAGHDQDLVIAGRDGIPANAGAVALNVEIATPSKAGYLRVTPGGMNSGTATQEFGAGQTISNLTVTKVGSGGSIRFHLSAGQATLYLDVTGVLLS